MLSRTFASDVLRNSLRIHDIAMPVDTGRPGNLHDERKRVRTRCANRANWACGYWDRASADPSQQRALKQKAQAQQRTLTLTPTLTLTLTLTLALTLLLLLPYPYPQP